MNLNVSWHLWFISLLSLVAPETRNQKHRTSEKSALPERLIDSETVLNYAVGQTARLVCPFRKHPSILYNWQKVFPNENHYVAVLDSRFETKEGGRVLKVRGITERDGGTYKCTAVTGYGSEDAIIYVYVSGPGIKDRESSKQLQAEAPSIISISPEVSHRDKLVKMVGKSMMLTCEVRGVPVPSIRWEKDGELIRSSIGPSGSLIIEKTNRDHSGNYSCIASNFFGMMKHTFIVLIVEKQPGKPEIIQVSSSRKEIREGYQATLQCKVRSEDSMIQINWFKWIERPLKDQDVLWYNGKAYSESEVSFSKINEGEYLSKLPLGPVALSQAGTYACFAISSVGFDTKKIHVPVLPEEKKKDELKVLLIVFAVFSALISFGCCICHYIRTSSKPIQVTERCSKDITGPNIHIDESCVKSKLENLNNEKSDTRSTWGSRTYSYNQFPLFHDCSQKDSTEGPCTPPPSKATSGSLITSQSSLLQEGLTQKCSTPPVGYRQPQNSSVSSIPSSVMHCDLEYEYEKICDNGSSISRHKEDSRSLYV
ncbi:fibroblast growth factor receptor-like 1 isoform X2 [Artemia franciscana]|uniref:fibroblast growth factor receptor-like 1 isoform X2 n=1 Tax=Artemia franciscana TaxID=6661 RepID=UPI0032DA0B41